MPTYRVQTCYRLTAFTEHEVEAGSEAEAVRKLAAEEADSSDFWENTEYDFDSSSSNWLTVIGGSNAETWAEYAPEGYEISDPIAFVEFKADGPPPAGLGIVRVRRMTGQELKREGWEEYRHTEAPICLEMSNGDLLYPSCDYEGNAPGALFGTSGGKTIYVLPPDEDVTEEGLGDAAQASN